MPRRKRHTTPDGALREAYEDTMGAFDLEGYKEWLADGCRWMLDPTPTSRATVEAYLKEQNP
jgi:hypothetical protein